MAIQVNGTAKFSEALKLHPDVLAYIGSLNPHDFQRLHVYRTKVLHESARPQAKWHARSQACR